MKQQLEDLQRQTLEQLKKLDSVQELEALRVKVLGRKGVLTGQMRQLGRMTPEERPAFGQMVNKIREDLTAVFDKAEKTLRDKENALRFAREEVDVTAPGTPCPKGSFHPLSLVLSDIRDIFTGMGFTVEEGPEIELDLYNFEMLNIPKDHPSRDEQDTFYINDTTVLRTQTSPVQARTMLKQKPPIKMICPGRVFRSDDVDATHSPVFHQIEGLVVAEGIQFGHLKWVLDQFVKQFFGSDIQTRFRPGFFPFTEPSAEVDATCAACKGKGCRICKGTGWIEILGCGMVHPNVLRACGVDPETYTGFAFGMGLDRLTNLKYNITDIRLLFDGDVRFLSQF